MNKLKRRAVVMMAVLISYTANAFNVTLKQKQSSVSEGDPLELLCETDRPIDSCEFRLQGFTKFRLKVYNGVKTPDYAFFGGFHQGVCGIRIFSANRTNHGPATCEVTYPNEDFIGEGRCNVTIQHMPKNVKLHSNKPNFEFEEGDLMEFNCTTDGGFPPPTITLRYDMKVVSVNANFSKIAELSDFDKKIDCVVDHPKNSIYDNFVYTRIVTVKAAPKLICKKEKCDVYEAEGNFTVGQKATIRVPVRAYPIPKLIEWTRAGQRLDHNRFMPWKDPIKILDGNWTEWIFSLDVTKLICEDLKTTFEISMWNDLGQQRFPLKISSTLENHECQDFMVYEPASVASATTKHKSSFLVMLSALALLACSSDILSNFTSSHSSKITSTKYASVPKNMIIFWCYVTDL